jgi:excisionase family DNA binding protein
VNATGRTSHRRGRGAVLLRLRPSVEASGVPCARGSRGSRRQRSGRAVGFTCSGYSSEPWITSAEAVEHPCETQRIHDLVYRQKQTAFRSDGRPAASLSPTGARRVADPVERGRTASGSFGRFRHSLQPSTERVRLGSMATNSDTLPRLLTVDEVSNLLHYSRSTVYRHIAAGDLPAVRLAGGPALRVRADALDSCGTRAEGPGRGASAGGADTCGVGGRLRGRRPGRRQEGRPRGEEGRRPPCRAGDQGGGCRSACSAPHRLAPVSRTSAPAS